MADLRETLAKFGWVTVFEPTFYELDDNGNKAIGGKTFSIDSLRISNITQEGPTKTAKGGLYATTQLRYGKTMRLEMEDVVGRIDVLENLMGVKVEGTGDNAKLQITDKFSAAMGIEGKTFIINQKTGEKDWVIITIFSFLPDSIFEQNMEAEGDFGAINIAGEIQPNKCGVFYEIKLTDNTECPAVEVKHEVEVTYGENGTASANKETAAKGEIVILTIEPVATYEVESVLVDGVSLEEDDAGVYAFVMPNDAVAVTVTFALI